MKNFFRHASSFIAPILVCIVIPYLVLAATKSNSPLFPSLVLAILGGGISLLGLILALISFRLLIKIGNGTIMPWDATKKLVIVSLYRFVRNPMILSILIILLGEATAFSSEWIYIAAVIFFIINTLYFRFSEEPGLEKRFGEEYLEYTRNVPRWMPRTSPWRPEVKKEDK
jgi:protein-S-isoprenylcysteine O-methyltransferase Ste14